ncbi:hypothetical protein NEIMUCOT_06684 [Neisseria mucosa ATCC 25996]|uniref:Uncharacterized protein n=1 Tax=Neisseria mucosa (strain ATCC 25996 / DSM 4631 / NCTC 10774 / M26) TaxID=546266 RepID=D3A190_NEIM2|nr:hypothetical protein NEIMUCOT_06684 [Neisseria mucosa ATCC 25996]
MIDVHLRGLIVSTHSRPKAAGPHKRQDQVRSNVSTHSRPKAAGIKGLKIPHTYIVSTHSRPKAAGIRSPRGHKTSVS